MAIPGHRTVSTFQRYDITDDADMRAALMRTQTHRATRRSQNSVVSTIQALKVWLVAILIPWILTR